MKLTRARAEALIVENYNFVLAYITKKLGDRNRAEDIVQEASIQVLQGYESLREIKYFRSWFVRIAFNRMLNSLRGRKVLVGLDDAINEIHCYEPDYVQEIQRARELEVVRAFAETLPHRQQQAFMLRIFDGMGFGDIAEIMNCPYDTAKANYGHAVEKIKKLVEIL